MDLAKFIPATALDEIPTINRTSDVPNAIKRCLEGIDLKLRMPIRKQMPISEKLIRPMPQIAIR